MKGKVLEMCNIETKPPGNPRAFGIINKPSLSAKNRHCSCGLLSPYAYVKFTMFLMEQRTEDCEG